MNKIHTAILSSLLLVLSSYSAPEPNIELPKVWINHSQLMAIYAPAHDYGEEGSILGQHILLAFAGDVWPDFKDDAIIVKDADEKPVVSILRSDLKKINLAGDDYGTSDILKLLKSKLPQYYKKYEKRIERLFYLDKKNVQMQFIKSTDEVKGERQVLISCVMDTNQGGHFGRIGKQCEGMKVIISDSDVRVTNFGDDGAPMILGKSPELTLDPHKVCTMKFNDGSKSTFKFARLPINSEVKDTYLIRKTLSPGVEYFLYIEK